MHHFRRIWSMATTRWEMPKMKPGYTVIDLSKTGSQTSWNFAPNQDVLFIGSTTTRTLDRLYVSGGHNISIVGGKFEPTKTGPSASIHINGVTGNVYIEGVHIDHKKIGMMDGIGVAGAAGSRPNLYIQNTIIDNIKGTQNGVHGDLVQRYGQLGDVKMYNVSGSTNYQGLFLNPHPGYEIRSVELENIDIVKNPGGDARTWTYYFYSPGHNEAYPVKLKNVYSSDGNVFPPPGYREGAEISGNKITFPNDAFSGHMTLGRPAGGDFAKPGDVGLGYKHGGGAGRVTGGAGNDVLDASSGGDVVNGGAGYDWLDYSAAPRAVAVNLASGTGKGGWAQGDVLRSIEALKGTRFADKLIGDAKANKLLGGRGDDGLEGRNGMDVLSGGDGRDKVVGGAGRDVVAGNNGNDRVFGNGGNDRMSGGAGADVLTGGSGNDRMNGGAGNDRFVITQGGDDVISDFNGLRDHVRLDDADFRNFADVRDAMRQVGDNTVINLGQGDSVTLLNCSVLSFRADDFSFG
jgi:hypothetical protein